jgi:hypothetical protein
MEVLVMAASHEPLFPSTLWAWRKVKIAQPPKALGAQPPKATYWHRFKRRDARTPITVTLALRGGPEAWIEVRGRGSVGRYPGWVSLYDVVADINCLR